MKRTITVEKRDSTCAKAWPLRLDVDIQRDITSKGATSRNLNESKVPTSLLLTLVSQRERNRVFSSMLLDRVSDGSLWTQRHVYS